MKAKLVFAVAVALCVTTTNVYGDIFSADNRGWWSSAGASNNAAATASTREYAAASFAGFNNNNYFTFDRSGWSGMHVVSGTFRIRNDNGTAGASLTLRDFVGSFATLTTATSGGAAIHADLGAGTVYGSGAIGTNTTNVIALNAAAIEELRNGGGTHFVMGGALTPANNTAFFGTDAGDVTDLDLVLQANTAPVSDPGGPYTIDAFDDLFMDGSASFDPDEAVGDSIVSWEWDVTGDATYDFTGETFNATWAQLVAAGVEHGNVYNLALRVTDEMGAQHVQTTLFTVNAAVPEPATCIIWALAGGSCGLASYRRRRKK